MNAQVWATVSSTTLLGKKAAYETVLLLLALEATPVARAGAIVVHETADVLRKSVHVSESKTGPGGSVLGAFGIAAGAAC